MLKVSSTQLVSLSFLCWLFTDYVVKKEGMQHKWYQSVFEKDIEAVKGVTGKKEKKRGLMNIVTQVRRALFRMAEPMLMYRSI